MKRCFIQFCIINNTSNNHIEIKIPLKADKVEKQEDGTFIVHAGDDSFHTKTVIVTTGKVVSTNPTSTKKAARLKRQQEQQ